MSRLTPLLFVTGFAISISGCKPCQPGQTKTLFSCTGTPTPVDAGFDAGDSFDAASIHHPMPDHPAPPNFPPECFEADLSPAQTIPVVPSTAPEASATGHVQFTLTLDASDQFQLAYQLNQSLPNATYAFVYESMPGVQGTPVMQLGGDTGITDASDSRVDITPELVSSLQGGEWFVTVMDDNRPEGALRGHVHPCETGAPEQTYVANLSGCLASPPNPVAGNAVASVIYDPNTTTATFQTSGMDDGATVTISGPGGTIMPSQLAANQTALAAGQLSVTVTTASGATLSAPLVPPGTTVFDANMNGNQLIPKSTSAGFGWAWVLLDYLGDSVHVIGSSTEANFSSVALVSGGTAIASKGGTEAGVDGGPAPVIDAGTQPAACMLPADAGMLATSNGGTPDGGSTSGEIGFEIPATAITSSQAAAIAGGLAAVVVSVPTGPEFGGRVTLPCEHVLQAALSPGLAAPAPTQSTNAGVIWAYVSPDSSSARLATETPLNVTKETWDLGVAGRPDLSPRQLNSTTIPGAGLDQGLGQVFIYTSGIFAGAQSELGGQLMQPGSTVLVAHLHASEAVPAIDGGPTDQGYAMIQLDPTSAIAAVTASVPASYTAVTLGRGVAGTASVEAVASLTLDGGSYWQTTLSVAPTDVAVMERGLMYVEATGPNGMIRGQILQPGDSLYTTIATGAGMVPPVSSSGNAPFQFIVSTFGTVRYDGEVRMNDPLGFSMYECTPDAGIVITRPVTPTQADTFQCTGSDFLYSSGTPGQINQPYLNEIKGTATDNACVIINGSNHPGGELRGTITPQ